MRVWITYVCSHFMDVQESTVSHSSAESEIISFDAGVRMDGLPALHFAECVFETLSSEPSDGTLSVTHAKESFRVIHFLTSVFSSQLTTFLPTFPTGHIQPNSTYTKTLRQ